MTQFRTCLRLYASSGSYPSSCEILYAVIENANDLEKMQYEFRYPFLKTRLLPINQGHSVVDVNVFFMATDLYHRNTSFAIPGFHPKLMRHNQYISVFHLDWCGTVTAICSLWYDVINVVLFYVLPNVRVIIFIAYLELCDVITGVLFFLMTNATVTVSYCPPRLMWRNHCSLIFSSD